MTPLIEAQLRTFFRDHPPRTTVADIGAGSDECVQQAMNETLRDPPPLARFDLDNLDIVRGRTPEPYATVVSCDMLEHCRQPYNAARNIVASIEKGGWLYVTTVFAYEHHEYPDDYWRFTTSALRELFCPSPEGKLQPSPMWLDGLLTEAGRVEPERCWYEEETPLESFGRRWRVSIVGQRT